MSLGVDGELLHLVRDVAQDPECGAGLGIVAVFAQLLHALQYRLPRRNRRYPVEIPVWLLAHLVTVLRGVGFSISLAGTGGVQVISAGSLR